jgi:protein Mpv17
VRQHRETPTPNTRVWQVLSVRRGGALEATPALVALDACWKAHPLAAAAVVCATKASLADLVAQRRQQRLQTAATSNATAGESRKLDVRRMFSFMTYGALYQGVMQELIYNNLYTYWFGSARTAGVVAKKVLFDAFFHNALICIPMAYAVKAFVFQYSFFTGIQQYIDDVRHHGLLLKYYAIWMPVNAMIFTIVPTHWRITVMAMVSFFWMILLSTISSRVRE